MTWICHCFCDVFDEVQGSARVLQLFVVGREMTSPHEQLF